MEKYNVITKQLPKKIKTIFKLNVIYSNFCNRKVTQSPNHLH